MSLRNILLTYLTLLLILAIIPHTTESSVKVLHLNLEVRLDYVIHSILFIPVVFLLKNGTGIKLFSALVIGCFFGLSLETIQLFLTYRTFNINDMVANVTGLIVGLALLLPVFSSRILKLKYVKA